MKNAIKKRLEKFGHAIRGIKILFQTEVHGKFHIFFALFVTLAGMFFSITSIEWCMIVICIAMVISAETINSAIERLTDLASPEYHPLAGKAKDLAARSGASLCYRCCDYRIYYIFAEGSLMDRLVGFFPKP